MLNYCIKIEDIKSNIFEDYGIMNLEHLWGTTSIQDIPILLK